MRCVRMESVGMKCVYKNGVCGYETCKNGVCGYEMCKNGVLAGPAPDGLGCLWAPGRECGH